MAKIISVRTSVKEDKVLVVFHIEGKEKPVFLTSKQVTSATGLKANFGILKGSDLDVVYHKQGDKLFSGGVADADDKLVKEFSIELSDIASKIAMAAGFGASMF